MPPRVGTIPVGTIVYIQDGLTPFGPRGRDRRPVRRAPWIVWAWLNRVHAAAYRGPDGTWVDAIMAGGYLALVESLRDGHTRLVADWLLRRSLSLTGEGDD